MHVTLRRPKDFWSGLLFIAFGLAFILIAQDYAMGTARRMGPAYFPTILGFILIAIGLAVAVRGLLLTGEPFGSFAFKPAVLITSAMVIFGVLVRDAGIVAAVVGLVLVSASASTRFSWRSSILLAVGLAIFCVLVFVKGLGLPFPVFGSLAGIR